MQQHQAARARHSTEEEGLLSKASGEEAAPSPHDPAVVKSSTTGKAHRLASPPSLNHLGASRRQMVGR